MSSTTSTCPVLLAGEQQNPPDTTGDPSDIPALTPPQSNATVTDYDSSGGGSGILEETEEGLRKAKEEVEQNARGLVLAAIGVLKRRKARPDAKRICNWVRRRHGLALTDVAQELDRLVADGGLTRVDFKGSISFRINTPRTGERAVAKRKKKTAAVPAAPTSVLSSDDGLMVQQQQMESSQRFFNMNGHSINGNNGFGGGTALVSNTSAQIDLEPSNFLIPPPPPYFVQHPPPLSLLLQQPQQFQPNFSPFPGVGCQMNQATSLLNTHSFMKSEDERKNDLIQEKLARLIAFKDKEQQHKGAGKESPVYAALREKRLSGGNRRDKKLDSSGKQLANDAVAGGETGRGSRGAKARKLKGQAKGKPNRRQVNVAPKPESGVSKKRNGRKEWNEKPIHDHNGRSSPKNGRQGSKREKKCRKIFDPTDYVQPSRKRAISGENFHLGLSKDRTATVEAVNGEMYHEEGAGRDCEQLLSLPASATSNGGSSVGEFLATPPPNLHPHTGLLPKNWEEYPQDFSIPDVSGWSAKQLVDYLSSQGLSPELAGIFLAQEIDGKSLLLLHRQDVMKSLGLRLGPALKVFQHIRRLQTRRNFPCN